MNDQPVEKTLFADQLAQAVRLRGNPLIVGLDPRQGMLPAVLQATAGRQSRATVAQNYQTFCCEIVDVVAELVAAVKPQAAFFEQLGPEGMQALAAVIRHATDRGLLVILDGKRNDIGSTAEAYADAYLGRRESAWGADALTVNPYLGDDSLIPFADVVDQRGAGIFVLVKTSNAGSGCFQDLTLEGQTLYVRVAAMVEQMSAARTGECGYGPIGAVVGATYPEQLGQMRAQMPHCWLLVPGFGSQGATAADVADAFDNHGLGAIINSSRAVIFAYRRDEYRDRFDERQWQRAVEQATRDTIDAIRSATRAGRL